jgi:hypothetical protein
VEVLVASLEDGLPEPLLGVELPELVLGVEPLEPVPDDPKLEFDEPPLKPPYVVSWSPLMPRRSRPNDCQAQ